jgi:beta-N-acetylhexosaminidase
MQRVAVLSLNDKTAPIIFGCEGPILSADEKAFFSDAQPAGFILFQKNTVDPDQVTRLCDELRDCVDWEAPILIDQEGGRVQRLKPPHWQNFPAPCGFGDVYLQNEAAALAAAENNIKGLADAQVPMGIDVNCIPCLDVVPADNDVKAIGDRCYSSDPAIVGAIGLAVARAAIAARMTPVMKHMPGHGRAVVDSHHDLPRVAVKREMLEADWQPFKLLARSIGDDQLWGMTAHVIYTALDPDFPATLSKTVISEIIRGAIGFEGLLLTDDLFMDALKPWGDIPARARLSIEAGNDLALHCHGSVLERSNAINVLPSIRPDTLARLDNWVRNRI